MGRKKCIDPARVPCEKARAYLEKRGLLCDAGSEPRRPKPKKRGWVKEWLG